MAEIDKLMLFHVKQHYLFLENQLKKKVSSVIINIEIEKVICRPKENASTCHVEAFLRG